MSRVCSYRSFRSVTGLLTSKATSRETTWHLRRALEWLGRAQDAVGDGGVSYGFGVLDGWWPAYPETTGYCIPTLLGSWELLRDDRLRRRAESMAEWELRVQQPDGSILGGPIGTSPPRSVAFDTGQVLQGWVAMYRETKAPEFLAAARRSADWLAATLSPAGAWCDVAPGRAAIPRSYNARTAWAVLDLAAVSLETDHRELAKRNIDWTLGCQRENGWFEHCAFIPGQPALTHTIAYVIEGLIGAWEHLRDSRVLDAAIRSADALHREFERRGTLLASFDAEWVSRDRYHCVTGCAQTALVWWRLAQITGRKDLAGSARRMNAWLKSVQVHAPKYPDLDGAIPGSQPICGAYERLRFPNWAAKFFADALLGELVADGYGPARVLKP